MYHLFVTAAEGAWDSDGTYQYRTLSLVGTHSSYTTGRHAFGDSLTDMRFGPAKEHLAMLFGLTRDSVGLGMRTMAPILKRHAQGQTTEMPARAAQRRAT